MPFERGGRRFDLIDTAGLRRRGKVFEAVEKFSVVKTLQAIAESNVVLLLLDATQGVTDQDAHIAGYILESGRAVVVAVNKWDAVDDYQKEQLQRSIEQRLPFLRFAPVLMISAKRRQGFTPVWKSIAEAHASATRKMPTPVLTRLLQEAVLHQAPKRAGTFRPKLRYAHQGGIQPALDRDPRQLARARDRRLQALPRRAHPQPLQAHRDAAANRDAVIEESVRRQARLTMALRRVPGRPLC